MVHRNISRSRSITTNVTYWVPRKGVIKQIKQANKHKDPKKSKMFPGVYTSPSNRVKFVGPSAEKMMAKIIKNMNNNADDKNDLNENGVGRNDKNSNTSSECSDSGVPDA